MNGDTNASSQPPPDDGQRPLEPPPLASHTWLSWAGILFVANLAGLVWSGLRDDSPPSVQLILDAFVQVGIGAVILFFAYKALVSFPFRMLDLLAMVIVLSFGVMATMDMLESLHAGDLWFEGPMLAREQLGGVVQANLLTASFLIAGAALGLRYCSRLNLDASRARVVAVVSGMLALPSLIGFMAFPPIILGQVFTQDDGGGEATLVLILLWIGSCIFLAWNVRYFVKSISNDAQIH